MTGISWSYNSLATLLDLINGGSSVALPSLFEAYYSTRSKEPHHHRATRSGNQISLVLWMARSQAHLVCLTTLVILASFLACAQALGPCKPQAVLTLIETLSASRTPRHTSYPNHLNTSSSLVQLGDYIAYNNDIFDITNITDPGPDGNRTLVAYGAGHCTVVQAPVPANETNFALFCHETFVFFAGQYEKSTLAFQLIDGFTALPQPPDAILGGSGYFSGATGQITYVTSPYANVSVNGEVYFSVSLC
ncbi:hypothetical protein KFL_000200110 [Klebsormidium nitens]|uniref:Dirigent protein n=1 Tax=Klebsormidium nitens TaxID=105231 RepID=A0A1Y1HSQ9_KLENI|nr:hypothetical protein KFL_000200110 [Klebsormidium nitens]|eukprot:GAQ78858.1 hypothetical protein KFL_000200110 [Klebsormidium nitens]